MAERAPESGLREVVHQRVRLGVLAVLDRRGACTFSQLRDVLGQSDGGLSRHLGVLEDHGYIASEKVFEDRRPRTWVHLTASGAEALAEEQELLRKLLARTEQDDGDDRTGAMTIVFAALLADEDGDTPVDGGRPLDGSIDRSTLVPGDPVLVAGRPARQIASGPISARYDFPATYRDFPEQREQRLMLRSHGLRGGWVATWRADAGHDGGLTAHAVVVELGTAHDCEAIIAMMGPSTVELPGAPAARGYLLPGAGDGDPATAVAWFSSGPFLASVSVVAAAGTAVPAAGELVVATHQALISRR